jgi:hypothetical protein
LPDASGAFPDEDQKTADDCRESNPAGLDEHLQVIIVGVGNGLFRRERTVVHGEHIFIISKPDAERVIIDDRQAVTPDFQPGVAIAAEA